MPPAVSIQTPAVSGLFPILPAHASALAGIWQESLKARAALTIATVLLIAAIGCAPGAGAESQPEDTPPSGTGDSESTPSARPTSTPWPQFGPPPVTEASITATVLAAPVEPTPTPVPTATPGIAPTPSLAVINGFGAPSEPMPTELDSSGIFEPVLEYDHLVPDGWSEVVGSDAIVLVHPDGLARVWLRERSADRTVIDTAADLEGMLVPTQFTDWSGRSLSTSRTVNENLHSMEFAGTWLGRPSVATVDWHLWGDLLVEVITEADGVVWPVDSKLRNTASLVADSFAPADEALVAAGEIEAIARARFGHHQSNIFVGSSQGLPPTQLSCRQVFLDLLSDPVYVGSGVWHLYAVTEQGAQVWEVFEPALRILPAPHNTSSC